AVEKTRDELRSIKSHIAEQMGDNHARIFDAHLMILDDVMVSEDTIDVIRKEKLNAAASFQRVVNRVMSSFDQIEDEYLKDRYVDIKDVKRRVLLHLLGRERGSVDKPVDPSIIVSHDLSPSDTAQLDRRMTMAFATDKGGRTSHTAILARSQGVPAVVGLEDVFDAVETGDTIIIDGNTGSVVTNPTKATIEDYEAEIKRFKELEDQLLTLTHYPAITIDDKQFMLCANLDLPEEVESVLEYGGQGVGLFRTEYFFISQDYLPSEDEQYKMYRSVAEKLGDRPVTFRTIDIGGDKIVGYLNNATELNPFMGWRGIRFCLTRKDIFKAQLRALYRTSAHGNIKIMFPMIAQIEEVIQAKEICNEVQVELKRGRYKFDPNVELGVMIETPSAVVMADAMAKEVDFFSIGTNDLIQYTLAVDRGNSRISHLYQNLHPSIIRSLKTTVEAAHKKKIHVGVCGEMCVDPLSVLVLIGLAIDEFSTSPNMIPEVKRIIRSVTYDECKSLVRRVLRYRTTSEIEREIEEFLKARVPSSPGVNGISK
ncbi:MAG: phosphoenolpyruvate--protein phosphotransferase, partial [Candidatus Krumholzibacteria bacterium]|nr:phosphoenolpyruvate--protein phosphotransferase [Candidatus Krumholzibacteria bacterium]